MSRRDSNDIGEKALSLDSRLPEDLAPMHIWEQAATPLYPATSRRLFVLTGCLGMALIAIAIGLFLVITVNRTRPEQPLLLVADVPTVTSTAMATHSRQRTAVPTVTRIPPSLTPTYTPTNTHTPTATFTPSSTPTATMTFTPTDTPPPAPRVQQARCVSVVGDSVAYGDAVYELPSVGYVVAHLAPISTYLNLQFEQRGLAMRALNRSAPAVGISSSNHPSYFGTLEYGLLLQDRCAYTVIIPWINDLTSWQDANNSAATHVNALAQLVQGILGANPSAKIILVNYYMGAPAPFATNFASGFNMPTVTAFNAQITAACSGGSLAVSQVRCVDANAAFSGMGTSHLSGPVMPADLRAALAQPVSAEEDAMLNQFASQGIPANGDGVHLSAAGKAALAAYLVQFMP